MVTQPQSNRAQQRRSAAPLMFTLAAAAGAGALLYTMKEAKAGTKKKKKKKKKKKDKKKDDVKPGKKPHPTIGPPFKPGRANEAHNAAQACKKKPVTHPRGKSRGPTQKLDDWLANVAYYESYDRGPTTIKAGDKKHSQAWLRIRAYVRKCLKKPDDKKDDDDTKPGTGTSFPDRACEILNSALAVKKKPRVFPKNSAPYNKQRSDQSDDAWWSNVVMWSCYPESPRKITGKASHKRWAKAWLRINKLVKFEIAKAKAGTDTGGDPSTDTKPTVETPDKKSQGGATEMRNAAIASVEKPTTFPRNAAPYNAWKGSNDKQAFPDWLSNTAFWSAWPSAPVKLSSAEKDKPYVASWLRIREHVKRGLANNLKISQKPPAPGGLTPKAWQKLAAGLAISSGLRNPAEIQNAYTKAVAYINGPGAATVAKYMGQPTVGNRKVSLSGLIAEAMIRVPGGKLSTFKNWAASPSRSFWTINGMF